MHINDDEERSILEQIYTKYKSRMYASAYRILSDPQQAEDAVHDSFIAISKHLDKLEDIDSVSTASYVIKAAKNIAINRAKKSFNEIPSLMNDEDIIIEENVLDEICTKENYQILVKAILSLDEKYCDVLSLYYLNDLSVSEIGDLLSRKENTVKQQLARGRHKLIKMIEKELD